jgi:hypothetical protein
MLAQVEVKAISERAMYNLQEFGIREVLAVNTSQGFTKQKEPVFFLMINKQDPTTWPGWAVQCESKPPMHTRSRKRDIQEVERE